MDIIDGNLITQGKIKVIKMTNTEYKIGIVVGLAIGFVIGFWSGVFFGNIWNNGDYDDWQKLQDMLACNLYAPGYAWHEFELRIQNQDWNICEYGEQMPGVQSMNKSKTPIQTIACMPGCRWVKPACAYNCPVRRTVWSMKNGSH